MLFNDIAYLISTEASTNDMADALDVPTERMVYCNKKSVRQTEFYQAAATGLRPELMLEVREADYNGEATVKHNGKIYSVIRVYPKNNEFTEIVCQGIVNKGGA